MSYLFQKLFAWGRGKKPLMDAAAWSESVRVRTDEWAGVSDAALIADCTFLFTLRAHVQRVQDVNDFDNCSVSAILTWVDGFPGRAVDAVDASGLPRGDSQCREVERAAWDAVAGFYADVLSQVRGLSSALVAMFDGRGLTIGEAKEEVRKEMRRRVWDGLRQRGSPALIEIQPV